MERYLGGWVRLRLTSADAMHRLDAIAREISVEAVRWTSSLTVEFCVRRRDVKYLTVRDGETVEQLRAYGLPELLKNLWRWRLFAGAVVAFGILTAWLPGRILFLSVEGNGEVPARLILEEAAKAGVYFGAPRQAVRSEQVKNHLLYAIDELRWAGVNTSGCKAVITVRPRQQEQRSPDRTPGDIVSVRDAVVMDIFPETGSVLVLRGQAVQAGEVLLSGTTDLGLLTRYDRAAGEVYGLTRREITVCQPETVTAYRQTGEVRRVFSLIFGKKRIYLSNATGISLDTCVKMVTKKELMLPGGFRLPVALVTETYFLTETEQVRRQEPEQLLSAARDYALQTMDAGEILRETVTSRGTSLTAVFQCREMLSRFRPREILEGDTNDNRETGERGTG